MTILSIEMTLPMHWASVLINGDLSGIENDAECDAISAFVRDFAQEHGSCHCVDVSDEFSDDHPGFVTYHDARAYLPLASDCGLFTFHV